MTPQSPITREGDRETLSREEARALLATPKKSKYGNVRVEIDGITFASKAEARRYTELKNLEHDGDISGLAMQVRYPLTVNGQKIATYVSDFDYLDRDGSPHVEDVKGTITPLFRIKRKLFEAIYDREITIVRMT